MSFGNNLSGGSGCTLKGPEVLSQCCGCQREPPFTKDTDRPGKVCETAMGDYAELLRAIAAQVLEARLSKGGRVLDASDFREWLIELAEKAEQAKTLEQFLSQV